MRYKWNVWYLLCHLLNMTPDCLRNTPLLSRYPFYRRGDEMVQMFFHKDTDVSHGKEMPSFKARTSGCVVHLYVISIVMKCQGTTNRLEPSFLLPHLAGSNLGCGEFSLPLFASFELGKSHLSLCPCYQCHFIVCTLYFYNSNHHSPFWDKQGVSQMRGWGRWVYSVCTFKMGDFFIFQRRFFKISFQPFGVFEERMNIIVFISLYAK